MRVRWRFGALCLALPSAGCGAIAQTIVGWHSDEPSVRREASKTIAIAVDPPGAAVSRIEGGQALPLGAAPLFDTVAYSVEEQRRSPSVLAVVIGGVVEAGLSAGAFVLARGQEKCFAEDDCFRTREPNKWLYAAGGVSAALSVADLITAWAHGVSDGEVVASEAGIVEREYRVEHAGFAEARRTIDAMKTERIALSLVPLPLPPPAPPPPPPVAAHATWVVAVMAVEGGIEALSDQLRVYVGQRGLRTIDRTSQDAAIHARVRELKLESYAACYDEACHIELGKALAATHILRARLVRFGERCVLNAELIDVTREVAVSAASSEGACEEEGYLSMSEKVAASILR